MKNIVNNNSTTADLIGFEKIIEIKKDVILLKQFSLQYDQRIMHEILNLSSSAAFRHMKMPTGHSLSVATTSSGKAGWVTDHLGYRYQTTDPITNKPWPPMPKIFKYLARLAADTAGFQDFNPESCLINRYSPGAKLSLHQDKNENALGAPVVSMSLGLPATFLFGGLTRTCPKMKIPLSHGDVIVWGGSARLSYHGILPIKDGNHPLCGSYRYNLTFREI